MISLTNPTGRKTEARVVTVGPAKLFFSYETCVGFEVEGKKYRSYHGSSTATTRRHMREFDLNYATYLYYTEFAEKMGEALYKAGCYATRDSLADT